MAGNGPEKILRGHAEMWEEPRILGEIGVLEVDLGLLRGRKGSHETLASLWWIEGEAESSH